MAGLFGHKNLLLCDMQGNNYGLLVKTIKKFPKSPIRPAGRVLTFDKNQIRMQAVGVWRNINRVTLKRDREFITLYV